MLSVFPTEIDRREFARKRELFYATILTPGFMLVEYTKANSLITGRNVIPDYLMNQAFGGDIPALYYPLDDKSKISMDYALELGLINRPLNTFEALQVKHPGFNSTMFGPLFRVKIVVLNCQQIGEISGSKAFVEDPDFIATVFNEHNIVKDLEELLDLKER